MLLVLCHRSEFVWLAVMLGFHLSIWLSSCFKQ